MDFQNVVEGQIIKLVDNIFMEAAEQKASDVHIEPLEQFTRVRLRVDGFLRTVLRLPVSQHSSIVSRIKIISGMDIAEKRVPQDGRVEVKHKERKVDVRVSTLPTLHGEKVVMRLLDKESSLLALEDLDFSDNNKKMFKNLIQVSNGMVLVTGPTGSGKSTTLYAILNYLNNEARNIITIEDPIEYQLDGINQVAVNKKAGLTFATGLRSIFRQDPNIIMVGEIRDKETAQIAVQAALTGHLVLSTLHTNNAAGAVTRLLDLGVEPFLVATALRGVVAQRLVRRVCPHCAEDGYATFLELAWLGCKNNGKVLLRKGKGCEHCHHTGYQGRLALQEVLPVTQVMQKLITTAVDEQGLLQEAIAAGFTDLRTDGVQKVLQGKTTIEELLRVVNI